MLQLPVILLSAALALPGAEGRPVVRSAAGSVTLANCLVTVSQQAAVAAREPGLLDDVLVKDGQSVTVGQPLAQIDDKREQKAYEAAVFKHQEEKAQAENDISVRYARAAADVAYAQVLTGNEANQKVPGSVTQSQMREWNLQHKSAQLQIEKSQFEQQVHAMEANVKKAEADTAQENINRRKVVPFDGLVVEIRKQKGEWVQPGDTVIQLIRVDRLWIEGFLNANEYSQAEIRDRPVTVTVTLAHGRRESFQGKVLFVKPEVEANNEFRVRAEVFNRQENDVWLLTKGETAESTIHLK